VSIDAVPLDGVLDDLLFIKNLKRTNNDEDVIVTGSGVFAMNNGDVHRHIPISTWKRFQKRKSFEGIKRLIQQ